MRWLAAWVAWFLVELFDKLCTVAVRTLPDRAEQLADWFHPIYVAGNRLYAYAYRLGSRYEGTGT